MKSSLAHLVPLAALGQCLSLPPLIPSIPGVTEPLNNLAPPLPILQIPTPALDSPPFTASDIKPKKIGYFWTGAGDKQHKGEWLGDPKPFCRWHADIVRRLPRHLQSG